MAGLLAARVLAEFYESVTVVERDELPDTAANRRGRWAAMLMPCWAAVP